MKSILLVVMVLAGTTSPALAAPVPFPDTGNSWYGYRDSIGYLVNRGAIDGYPDGNFKPKAIVNRAEFLKMIFRAKAPVEPVTGECFRDVPADAWYAPYVCAAQRRGIVSGYPLPGRQFPAAVFKPEQAVNIAEAVKMIVLAYGREVTEGPGNDWYEPYASELDRSGILSRHSYIPWEALTRERAADIIARFLRHDDDRAILNLSPGCGKVTSSTPSSVTVNGLERKFLLTIPNNYVAHDPSPLIVAFHGRTNSNEQVRRYMGFDRNASEFFVAYPEAIKNSKGTFSWDMGSERGIDVAFFDALIEELSHKYCIDMDRIFVAGHSLGAWAANSVACIRGGVVRASGTVAGDSIIASCAGPAAAMMIHHPADALSPISGAERARDMRLKRNACENSAEITEPQTLRCQIYRRCDGGNAVVWCPHTNNIDSQGNNYPHNWPREAGSAITEFFRARK